MAGAYLDGGGGSGEQKIDRLRCGGFFFLAGIRGACGWIGIQGAYACGEIYRLGLGKEAGSAGTERAGGRGGFGCGVRPHHAVSRSVSRGLQAPRWTFQFHIAAPVWAYSDPEGCLVHENRYFPSLWAGPGEFVSFSVFFHSFVFSKIHMFQKVKPM